ncbi:ATP-binding protein [Salinarimonas sp.]|uniref:sensor histidine kinase n=1 Tax=Salinarimonas sp. TaxID=2766526 RepID=UPI0032D9060E
MSVGRVRRPGRLALVVALIAACGFFIAATAAVYVRQIEQKALLTETIRASGWTAYQAQLEHVKSLGVLDLALEAPSAARLGELSLRLEILLSRAPLITHSDEGDFLSQLPGVPEMARRLEVEVEAVLDELYALDADDPAIGVRLTDWRARLEPFGVDLQRMLQQTIAYNERLYRREGELREAAAFLPLGSLVASGAVLVLMLLLQVSRAERGLEQMRVARAEAAENEASLRRIVEAAPVAFVVADPHTDAVVFINRSAAELIEADPRASAWRAAVGQCRRAVAARAFVQAGVREAFVPATLRHPGGGLISCNVMQSRVVWNGREQTLYALVETTRSRNAERQALQASTLAAIGEMAAAIVHEINQPLATMKMASSNALALIDEGAEPARVRAKLARIDAQVDRARRITEQIRRLVRRDAERPRTPFSPQEAIELAAGAVAEQFQQAEVPLALSIEAARGLSVAGDQTLFEQVIVNLLVNACDAFGPPETRAPAAPAPCVRIAAEVADGWLRIVVADNAGGLAPEIAERPFDAFVTTKAPGEGTGLGLALARKIVVDMGGRIAHADIDGGARFEVAAPILASGADARDAA